jgi:CRP/FNR family transcriptional regulator, cyclic AMP receptor protein
MKPVPEAALGVIQTSFGCAPALASVISGRARYSHYVPQEALIESGEQVDTAFLIITGRAREMALSLDGRALVVQDFVPGDLFGESVILGELLATEEVIALEATDAGLFGAGDLVALIENYSCVALAFSKLMTRRLRQTRRRLVEGVTLSAAGRIHAELLRQARASTALTINPAPVLTEFALLVQSTRETVSRTIGALEKRGIIKRDGDGLRVVAPHRLEELIL